MGVGAIVFWECPVPRALAAVLIAVALPAGRLSVDPAASTIRFHVVHKFHRVHGQSSQIEGKAVVKEDGTVLVMARVAVASFQSGDANRDAHMLEALEVGQHPFVVFKGSTRLDSAEQPSGPVTMQGELDLHGVKRAVTVPLTVEFRPDGTVRVRGSFQTSLDAHRIERPSLLFVKVDDACLIDVDLLLGAEKG